MFLIISLYFYWGERFVLHPSLFSNRRARISLTTRQRGVAATDGPSTSTSPSTTRVTHPLGTPMHSGVPCQSRVCYACCLYFARMTPLEPLTLHFLACLLQYVTMTSVPLLLALYSKNTFSFMPQLTWNTFLHLSWLHSTVTPSVSLQYSHFWNVIGCMFE